MFKIAIVPTGRTTKAGKPIFKAAPTKTSIKRAVSAKRVQTFGSGGRKISDTQRVKVTIGGVEKFVTPERALALSKEGSRQFIEAQQKQAEISRLTEIEIKKAGFDIEKITARQDSQREKVARLLIEEQRARGTKAEALFKQRRIEEQAKLGKLERGKAVLVRFTTATGRRVIKIQVLTKRIKKVVKPKGEPFKTLGGLISVEKILPILTKEGKIDLPEIIRRGKRVISRKEFELELGRIKRPTERILTGLGLFGVSAGVGFFKGATALVRPKFFLEEIPATARLLTAPFRGEFFPEIGEEIRRRPQVLAEIAGFQKGFGFTTQQLTKLAIKPRLKPPKPLSKAELEKRFGKTIAEEVGESKPTEIEKITFREFLKEKKAGRGIIPFEQVGRQVPLKLRITRAFRRRFPRKISKELISSAPRERIEIEVPKELGGGKIEIEKIKGVFREPKVPPKPKKILGEPGRAVTSADFSVEVAQKLGKQLRKGPFDPLTEQFTKPRGAAGRLAQIFGPRQQQLIILEEQPVPPRPIAQLIFPDIITLKSVLGIRQVVPIVSPVISLAAIRVKGLPSLVESQKVIQQQRVIQSQSVVQEQRQLQKQVQSQIQKQAQVQVQRQIQVQEEIQVPITAQISVTAQAQIQEQRQALRQRVVQVAEQLEVTTPSLVTLEVTERPKKKKIGRFEGYNAFVKGRKGKQLKVNLRRTLTKQSALSSSARVVDNSIAATGSIKKVISSRSPLDTKDKYFQRNRDKFRTFRIRKGKRIPLKDKFIEKRGKRLDTRGEVLQITAAKKIAQQRKRLARLDVLGTQAKPKKRRSRKQPREEFSLDLFPTPRRKKRRRTVRFF